ncbi:MAG TPA: succinate dehydrogenase [Acidobacteriota bacterium]|nr:succinate dehydrogenase [Acidobacteriota bacterium]
MANTAAALAEQQLGATLRKDPWWGHPLLAGGTLIGFGIYAFWVAIAGEHYRWGPYLSPFYSPFFLPDWWAYSPAFLVMWIPLGFRGTCYYFRKIYYRSFFLDPAACAVGEPKRNYKGETRFFLFQNLHRFFLYMALILVVLHVHHLWEALWWPVAGVSADGSLLAGPHKFGIGVGTLFILVDVLLLAFYVFGCHCWRHLVGGGLTCYSGRKLGKARHTLWQKFTWFNTRHNLWGWTSLTWVGLTDLYIRLVAMGVISDARLF